MTDLANLTALAQAATPMTKGEADYYAAVTPDTILGLVARVRALENVRVLATTVLAIPHPHPSAPGNLYDAGNCLECKTEEQLRDALIALTPSEPRDG